MGETAAAAAAAAGVSSAEVTESARRAGEVIRMSTAGAAAAAEFERYKLSDVVTAPLPGGDTSLVINGEPKAPQIVRVFDAAAAAGAGPVTYEVSGGVRVMAGVVGLRYARKVKDGGLGELLAEVIVVSGRVEVVSREV